MFNSFLSSFYNLCTVYNIGVVNDLQSGSNSTPNAPINEETTNIFLDNGIGILIAILIIVIIALIGMAVLYILKHKEQKKKNANNENKVQQPDTEENEILLQYSQLNEQEKQLIKNTLKTLNDKDK